MTFQIHGTARAESTPLNGLQCVAYAESRFLGTPPVYGSPFPDLSAADAGPVVSSEAFGGVAAYTLTVPSAGNYWVGCYAIGDPNQIITWEGPKMATPHTSLQGWTGAVTHVPSVPTNIAAASNGATLPTGTINVTALGALGFPSSGNLLISASGVWTLVAYTGKTTGSFTGCTGGSGTLSTGDKVLQAFIAGTQRLWLTAQALCKSNANGDSANIQALTSRSGVLGIVGGAPGLTSCVSGVQGYTETNFPCDPLSPWGLIVNTSGTGSVSGAVVEEIDF